MKTTDLVKVFLGIFKKPYLKVPMLYMLFGVLWIFFSDRIIQPLAGSSNILTKLQTYKGWFFIVITTILLFGLIRRSYLRLLEREKEKERIYFATMGAVQHVLNNFLNKMEYFKMEAEESGAFSKETMDLYSNVIKETSGEIQNLSNLKDITEEKINNIVHKKII